MSKRGEEKYIDYNLLVITIFLLCFGLVMLYSASAYDATIEYGSPTYYLKRQIFSTFIGLVLMYVVIKFGYKIYKSPTIALLAYIGSLIVSLLVLSPIGISSHGASRWIKIGPMSLQVCEAVKLGVIIFMAFIISKKANKLRSIKMFSISLLYVIIAAGLIAFVTSDLSSAMIIGAIGVIMLIVANTKLSYLLPMGALVAVLFILAVVVAPYRFTRIRVWLNPEAYADGDGFQVMQALYAVGSGGLFGKGLGNGVQKLGNIPESQNDMVYTVICEELGVVGGIAVILIFMFMIWRFAVIANNVDDLFGSMLVVGVMAHIGVQAVVNLAVVMNLFPNTGVPLPFLSYGGSSIMILLIEIGIVLAVSKEIKFK